MQKIMFNEKYGLQRAAIDGTKPMTRRAVPEKWQTPLTEIFEDCNYNYSQFWKISDVQFITNEKAPYKVGDVVAVAQSYKDAGLSPNDIIGHIDYGGNMYGFLLAGDVPGWSNKMFVKADLMPNLIRITDIKVERLHDISDEDCLKEGIIPKKLDYTPAGYHKGLTYYGFEGWGVVSDHAKDAFAALIDKVSGRGTWDRNPWVFAYSFELVK